MSLKIQLSVLAVPCIVVVCPPPRAYLSISGLSRPSRQALWVKSGHPVMGQRTDSWCVFLSSHPGPEPKPHGPLSPTISLGESKASTIQEIPLSSAAVRKPGEALCAVMERFPRYLVCHMHKGRSRTAGRGGPVSCSKGEGL